MQVTIYTTPYCPYCHRAKHLLSRKGVPFEEINVMGDNDKRVWLLKQTGSRTVPQIFVGDKHIGDCDEIHRLDRQGQLDQLLSGTTV